MVLPKSQVAEAHIQAGRDLDFKDISHCSFLIFDNGIFLTLTKAIE